MNARRVVFGLCQTLLNFLDLLIMFVSASSWHRLPSRNVLTS